MTKNKIKKIKKLNEELLVYQAKNGAIELKGDITSQAIWANKLQIANIFGIDRSVVSRHIKNIFLDKEIDEKEVCANFAQTTAHGSIKGKTQTRYLEYYNLDIILAVGYRTKSSLALEFRKWATKTLKQHIVQGFTLTKILLKIIIKNFCKRLMK